MSFIGQPFITIVMPCYNSEQHLEKSLDVFLSLLLSEWVER